MADSTVPQVLRNLFSIEAHLKDFKWESFRAGIEIHRIYGEAGTGPTAALLRYAPGAEVPVHIHNGYEHILILSGSQTDGSQVYEKGALVISAPGSEHRIASEHGCVVLAIWQAPVDFKRNVQ